MNTPRPKTSPDSLETIGLEQLIVATTSIGAVRGKEGFYHYREYSAIDCAEHCTLEEVWHLMFMGHLPRQNELTAFRLAIGTLQKDLYPTVLERIHAVVDPDHGNVMADIRTVVSAVGDQLMLPAMLDQSNEERIHTAMIFAALMPCITTAVVRLRAHQLPIPPHTELGYTENYLTMLTGNAPRPDAIRALESYLISTIEHGFNTSTFTARVVTSTGADMAASIVAAIGALSGPLHGGAPSRALELLDILHTPAEADTYVRACCARGERVMGFGHRIYETEDPRARMLRNIAASFNTPHAKHAIEMEQQIFATLHEVKPGRRINTNVEFYAGVVMECCAVPPAAFTATFLSSRTIGWSTHILEQAANNRLMRPDARYVGPQPTVPLPEHILRR